MSEYVPDAVTEQILIHLPRTTLVRFTSVSKSWHSLIHSHSFTISHFHHSFSTSTLFLIQRSYPLLSPSSFLTFSPFPPFLRISKFQPPFPSPHPFHFVQSLYGVVCLTQQDHCVLILWNPSIRRYLTLQSPPLKPKALGFGFDSKSRDFKLIRFGNSCRVKVYSLNHGAWRDLDFSCEGVSRSVMFSNGSCFVNGNVHWIVQNAILFVLVFDVEEERFKRIELPLELVNLWRLQLKITVIEGCISVLFHDNNEWCDIWMMREYGVFDSWAKISTPNLRGRIRDVFGMSTSSNVLMPWSYRGRNNSVSLCSFDPKSQEITNLRISGNDITACDYTGSLFLLDKGTGTTFGDRNRHKSWGQRIFIPTARCKTLQILIDQISERT